MSQCPRTTIRAPVPTSATAQVQTAAAATVALPLAQSTRQIQTTRVLLFLTPTSSIRSMVWHTPLQARSCPTAEIPSVGYLARNMTSAVAELCPCSGCHRRRAGKHSCRGLLSRKLMFPPQLISQLTSVSSFPPGSTDDRSF